MANRLVESYLEKRGITGGNVNAKNLENLRMYFGL
jgi:hypothetical protein